MKTLIAEDDAVAQRILRLTLEKFGHEVIVANDGQEAWETLICRSVPVVVSDWMMPRLDGLELCKKIRTRRRQKEYTYFIMVTALTSREHYLQAMEVGVDDFLTKPLRQDELMLRFRVAERILGFMNQLRDLKRLLPICTYCKKVRDDKDYWHQIETYMSQYTSTDFSHGICPECYEKVVKPQLSVREAEPPPAEGD